MITLEIDIAQLKHALMTTPKGAKCVILPIEENEFEIYESKIKLKLVGFEYEDKRPNIQYKNTHLLKQYFTKEQLEAMPKEKKDAIPILGNARVSGSGQHADAPPKDLNNGKIASDPKDLPF